MRSILALLLGIALAPPPALATIRGLNQIVTPSVQPPRTLSATWREQNRSLGNPRRLQLEAGLVRRVGVAWDHGFSPSKDRFAVEGGILQGDPILLSAGVADLSARGRSQREFIIARHTGGVTSPVFGLQLVRRKVEGILGWIIPLSGPSQIQLDYVTGAENAFTVGVAWTVLGRVQLNPAAYRLNAGPHRWVGHAAVGLLLP